MGANEPPDMDDVGMKATLDARPIRRVYVDGFYIDKTDVTNADFAEFVKATGYLTVAERTPSREDYPTAPPENLVAGSVVFAPPRSPRLARQSLPMVELHPWHELASPARSAERHQRQGQLPRRPDRL